MSSVLLSLSDSIGEHPCVVTFSPAPHLPEQVELHHATLYNSIVLPIECISQEQIENWQESARRCIKQWTKESIDAMEEARDYGGYVALSRYWN